MALEVRDPRSIVHSGAPSRRRFVSVPLQYWPGPDGWLGMELRLT